MIKLIVNTNEPGRDCSDIVRKFGFLFGDRVDRDDVCDTLSVNRHDRKINTLTVGAKQSNPNDQLRIFVPDIVAAKRCLVYGYTA